MLQFYYNLLPNYLQIKVSNHFITSRAVGCLAAVKLNVVDIYKLLNYPNNFLITSALETSRILPNSFIIALSVPIFVGLYAGIVIL
ncbi:MAG: hypothetical protein K6343_05935 [Caldisericaceae bacterium]